MDTIGDFLTILRNAVRAHLDSFEAPASRMRIEISKILKNAGYVEDFDEVLDPCGHRRVRVTLRYVEGQSPLRSIARCSRPGRRVYCEAKKLPRVLNGLGIAIVSTSQGLMRDSEARRRRVGGEVLCKIC
jgi:small subunit ribosomal protein S8